MPVEIIRASKFLKIFLAKVIHSPGFSPKLAAAPPLRISPSGHRFLYRSGSKHRSPCLQQTPPPAAGRSSDFEIPPPAIDRNPCCRRGQEVSGHRGKTGKPNPPARSGSGSVAAKMKNLHPGSGCRIFDGKICAGQRGSVGKWLKPAS